MRLHRETLVPAPLADVFAFFSDPRNLAVITPPGVRFRIVDAGDIPMREGSSMSYRFRVFGLPLRWKSRITMWKQNDSFVDVQESGPFKRWHHTHTFRAAEEGTLMIDDVEYEAPFAFLTRELVRRKLESIFDYRSDHVGAGFSRPWAG